MTAGWGGVRGWSRWTGVFLRVACPFALHCFHHVSERKSTHSHRDSIMRGSIPHTVELSTVTQHGALPSLTQSGRTGKPSAIEQRLCVGHAWKYVREVRATQAQRSTAWLAHQGVCQALLHDGFRALQRALVLLNSPETASRDFPHLQLSLQVRNLSLHLLHLPRKRQAGPGGKRKEYYTPA